MLPNNVVTQLLATIAGLGITGAVATGVAYWLFKTLAKSWLDSKFQQDLEKFRSANVREVERLKAELSRYADRATKFHVREYEVLPEAWGLMNRAFGACHQAIAAFQEFAGLDQMPSPQLEEWLAESDLKDSQRDKIRNSSNKIDTYSEILSWKQIGDAQKATSDFQNYVVIQGIFIEESLSQRMLEAAISMRKALVSRRMVEITKNRYTPNQTDFWTQANELLETVGKEVQEIKEIIRSRLSDISAPEQ